MMLKHKKAQKQEMNVQNFNAKNNIWCTFLYPETLCAKNEKPIYDI